MGIFVFKCRLRSFRLQNSFLFSKSFLLSREQNVVFCWLLSFRKQFCLAFPRPHHIANITLNVNKKALLLAFRLQQQSATFTLWKLISLNFSKRSRVVVGPSAFMEAFDYFTILFTSDWISVEKEGGNPISPCAATF